jgi:hypothetical protein
MNGYADAEITAARGAANYMAHQETSDLDDPDVEEQEDGTFETTLSPGKARANHARLQAIPDRIPSRQEGRACRGPNRLHIKLIQNRSGGGDAIDVRRLDFLAAAKADIRTSQIIHEEKDDVRLRCRVSRQREGERHGKD